VANYQNRDDLQKIPEVLALAAPEGNSFMAFNHAAERGDGALAHALLALRLYGEGSGD
jgi:hypothetical protein